MKVGPHTVGDGAPLLCILGPCVIESEELTLRIAAGIAEICTRLDLPWVFKASFDKANRSSKGSFRGIGMMEGLEILGKVRERIGVPVTTDVHLPDQAQVVAEVVDLLQVPAFLCRQTDLLEACAATARPVNVKKGQFMAPEDMAGAVGKLKPGLAMLTERGACFGYHNLVVDFRAFPTMRALGVPVCFDATHAVQQPGGPTTGGDRRFVPPLARAAVAVGIDALFMEVHPTPESSPSDGPNMLPLDQLEVLLRRLLAIRAVAA